MTYYSFLIKPKKKMNSSQKWHPQHLARLQGLLIISGKYPSLFSCKKQRRNFASSHIKTLFYLFTFFSCMIKFNLYFSFLNQFFYKLGVKEFLLSCTLLYNYIGYCHLSIFNHSYQKLNFC